MKERSLILAFLLLHCAECHRKSDLFFIMDTSRDMGRANIKATIDFIKNFLEYYSISHSNTRVALITFGSKVHLKISLNSCGNRRCVVHHLNLLSSRAKHSRSFNGIFRALALARKLIRRHGRRHVYRGIVLFTTRNIYKHRAYKKMLHTKKLLGRERIRFQIVVFGTRSFKSSSLPLQEISDKGGLKKLLKQWFKYKLKYTTCKGQGVVYDECHRKCKCVDGKLKHCARVRKEITTLTRKELQRYISVYKRVASSPIYRKKYEKLTIIHKDFFWSGIHDRNQFFPWHRWYLLKFENLLRQVDCRVTVPFWDWSYWSPVAWRTDLHLWKRKYFGGNGNRRKDFCVEDGQFQRRKFNTPSYDKPGYIFSYTVDQEISSRHVSALHPHPYCVRRSFNGKPPRFHVVNKTVNLALSDFFQFELAVRDIFHNNIHCQIGGTMCTEYASSVPEFWLHHAMLDYIWYRWQIRSKEHRDKYFVKKNSKLKVCRRRSRELVNCKYLPGHVSVLYNLFKLDEAYRFEKGHRYQTRDISIYQSNVASRRELFRMSKDEALRADIVAKRIFGME